MIAFLDIAGPDRPIDLCKQVDDSPRRIGEILPFVLAKYEIVHDDESPEDLLELIEAAVD